MYVANASESESIHYMANYLLTKNRLVHTRRGSYYGSGRRFFCRRWLPSGRCISRRSLLGCCGFNARCRIFQSCRNSCDNRIDFLKPK